MSNKENINTKSDYDASNISNMRDFDKKNKKDVRALKEKNNIVVQLLNINGDVTKYDDVVYIKIISQNYNLIIMEDYLPIIGEIKGKVEIGRADDVVKLDNVNGYYMNKHNVFNLFFIN